MSDLVERLRIIASGVIHDGDDWVVVREAADEIERLQAVVDAARAECGEIIRDADHNLDAHHDADLGRIRWLARRDAAREILRALDGEVKP
jgi:hypothetical protein